MSKVYSSVLNNPTPLLNNLKPASNSSVMDINSNESSQSIIGLYGNWAASFNKNRLPTFSFRNKHWANINKWRKAAKQRIVERMAIPEIGDMPKVNIVKQ